MVQAKLPSLIFKIIANIKFAILEMETSVVWEMSNHREKRGQNFGPGVVVVVCVCVRGGGLNCTHVTIFLLGISSFISPMFMIL